MYSGSAGRSEFRFGEEFNRISTNNQPKKPSLELLDQFSTSQFHFSQLDAGAHSSDANRNNDLELYGLGTQNQPGYCFKFDSQPEQYLSNRDEINDSGYGFTYHEHDARSNAVHSETRMNQDKQIDFEFKDNFSDFNPQRLSVKNQVEFSQFSASNKLESNEPFGLIDSLRKDGNQTKQKLERETNSIYDIFNFEDQTNDPVPKCIPKSQIQGHTNRSEIKGPAGVFQKEDMNIEAEIEKPIIISNKTTNPLIEDPPSHTNVSALPSRLHPNQPPVHSAAFTPNHQSADLSTFRANPNHQLVKAEVHLFQAPKRVNNAPFDHSASKLLFNAFQPKIQPIPETNKLCLPDPLKNAPCLNTSLNFQERMFSRFEEKESIPLKPHFDFSKPQKTQIGILPLGTHTPLSILPLTTKPQPVQIADQGKLNPKVSLSPTGLSFVPCESIKAPAFVGLQPSMPLIRPVDRPIMSKEAALPQIKMLNEKQTDGETVLYTALSIQPLKQGTVAAAEPKKSFRPQFNLGALQPVSRLLVDERNREVQPLCNPMSLKTVKLNSGCSEPKRTEMNCLAHKTMALQANPGIPLSSNAEPIARNKLKIEGNRGREGAERADGNGKWGGEQLFAEEEAKRLSEGFQELKTRQLSIKEAHIKCLYHEGRINTMKVYLKNQLESLKRLSAAL